MYARVKEPAGSKHQQYAATVTIIAKESKNGITTSATNNYLTVCMCKTKKKINYKKIPIYKK